MASIIAGKGKKKSRSFQYYEPGGRRRTIGLGECGAEPARRFKGRIDSLQAFRAVGQMPDMETSQWLAGLPDDMHAKLSRVGLVSPGVPEPKSPRLMAWTDRYVHQREGDWKPATLKAMKRTAATLVEQFDADTPIDTSTQDDAAQWRSKLRKTLAGASVRHYIRNAKLFFAEAACRGHIAASPFLKQASASVASSNDRYITDAESTQIIEACPNE